MEIFIIVGIFVIAIILKKPSRCTICKTPFKRNYYKWKIDGKNVYLCPNCNRKMERESSNSAFNSKFKI